MKVGLTLLPYCDSHFAVYTCIKLKINKRHFVYWNVLNYLTNIYWASKSGNAYISFWEQKSESWSLEEGTNKCKISVDKNYRGKVYGATKLYGRKIWLVQGGREGFPEELVILLNLTLPVLSASITVLFIFYLKVSIRNFKLRR